MVMNFTLIPLQVLVEYIKCFIKTEKKVIPLNIYEYLTPFALAVLIMDDGC
jgi:hypothetical protein